MSLQIDWRDEAAKQPPLPVGYRGVTATVSAPETTNDLREAMYAAAQSLGADLVAQGATPSHIQTLTISVADTKAFEEDIQELGLRYRECLGGNMGRVALITGSGSLQLSAYAQVPPSSDVPIYGPYSVDELNRQYSPRSSVPEAGAIMAKWRVEGTAYQTTRAAEVMVNDCPQKSADLYLPRDVDTPPLHIFIHGGYWQALNKRDNSQLADSLVKSGIAVAVIDYPLAPPTKIDEIISVCQSVIERLYNSAGKYGYGSNQITISGHSAGGHLVAEMAATDWSTVNPDLPEDLIKGTVAISGLFELEPLRHTGLNNALKMDAAEAEGLSPLFKQIRSPGPFIAAVGGAESDEFKRQSRDFSDRKTGEKTPVSYMELPNLNHFTVVEALNDPNSPLFEAVHRIAKAID